MDALLFDIRYAARRLRQSPAFALMVILTLALGIGANSAIFSVVNGVLLRPLPYTEPDRLVTIFHQYPSLKLEAPVSAPGFKDYRDRTHSFSGVAVEVPWNVNLTGVGEPERLRGVKVSALFFSALGVPALAGRTFRPEEDAIGNEHEIVISDGLWKRIFGGQRAALGRKVSLNNESYDIIGVMPPGFYDPANRDAEVWSPIALDPKLFVPNNYTNEFLTLVARIKPGVTLQQASRDMTALAEQLKQENSNQFPKDWTLETKSLIESGTGKISPALLILLGAVGFVLLIACANVANLMLARAAARHKEVAIRTALGANRWALTRQLLVESLMLACLGGVVGLLLAYVSVRALVAVNPSNIPRVADLNVDGRVIAFTAILSVVTGIIFGLVPALQTSRDNLHITLKEGGRSGTADRSGQLVRRVLVVAEVALALTLLTCGGLVIRSFMQLSSVDPGFNPHNVLTFNLSLPQTAYPNDTVTRQFYANVIPRNAPVPGVQSAGGTTVIPFGGTWSTGSFNVEGFTPPPNVNGPWGDIRLVSGDCFKTLQIPKIKDACSAAKTICAHPSWPSWTRSSFTTSTNPPTIPSVNASGSDPINRTAQPNTSPSWASWVTPSTRGSTPIRGCRCTSPHLSLAGPSTTPDLAVRTSGDPKAYVTAIRNAIHDVDHNLPMARVRTMDDMVEASMGQRRLSTVLLGVFAAVALLLASIGIYGVMSYTVTQRTSDLCVRVALGAPRYSVLALVMGQGMLMVTIGIGIGLAGAFGLTRLMASQLFNVRPTDPWTFTSVTVILAGVALAATLFPALRATRVDPMVALREE